MSKENFEPRWTIDNKKASNYAGFRCFFGCLWTFWDHPFCGGGGYRTPVRSISKAVSTGLSDNFNFIFGRSHRHDFPRTSLISFAPRYQTSGELSHCFTSYNSRGRRKVRRSLTKQRELKVPDRHLYFCLSLTSYKHARPATRLLRTPSKLFRPLHSTKLIKVHLRR